jgi:hypothetical protein
MRTAHDPSCECCPLQIRQSWFAHLGNFQTNFSCPGDPGIGFDFEYSVRLWNAGAHVALWDPLWAHHIHEGVALKSISKVRAHKSLQPARARPHRSFATHSELLRSS